MKPTPATLLLGLLIIFLISCNDTIPNEAATIQSKGDNPSSPRLISGSPWENMQSLAESLSREPERQDALDIPQILNELNYEQYRSIRYRPEKALWKGESPFEIQMFHLGFLYKKPIQIFVLDQTKETLHPLLFDESLFQYDYPAPATIKGSSIPGYAGFRIHYPLNQPNIADELAVFLGASYFRLLGPGQAHGLSSRGLAIDSGLNRPEEFPIFTEFWLVQPDHNTETLEFYALLESPSITGAYKFELAARETTSLKVTSYLYPRKNIEKLGVAPLTSMFLYGPEQASQFDDYRPQIHDSDGLLVGTNDKAWEWRPLRNRQRVRLNSFVTTNLSGFGLVQRSREFSQFLDLEAQYHRRPSQWVSLNNADWGPGKVELLEIPSSQEFNDNIVSYWVPEEKINKGDTLHYSYVLDTFNDRHPSQTLGQVKRTITGSAGLPGEIPASPVENRRFVIDFEDIPNLDATNEVAILPDLHLTSGEFSELVLIKLPLENEWRATFKFIPDTESVSVLTLSLKKNETPITETWSYVWYPEIP